MQKIRLSFEAYLKILFGCIGIYLIGAQIFLVTPANQPLLYYSLLCILIGTILGVSNHFDLLFFRKRQELYFRNERRTHLFFLPASLILASPFNFVLAIGLFSVILTESQKLPSAALRRSLNVSFVVTYALFLVLCIVGDLLNLETLELNRSAAIFIILVGITMTAVLIFKVFKSMTELKESQEQLLVLNQEKNWYSDLFSLVSHNLRTPLTTVLNILQIEELRKTEFAGSENFTALKSETQKVLSIADQSLRKNAWMKQKSMKLYDIRDLINSEYENVTIHSGVTKKTGAIVLSSAEATALTLALDSTLSNSFKYGGEKVTISSCERLDSKRIFVDISITDDGIGMTKEQLERYGTAFNSTSSSDSGTGLGVYFTISLMKQLDWSVTVESEVHKGTTVTFNLFFDLHRLD